MSSKETEQKLDQALQSGIVDVKMRRDNHTGCLVRRKKSKNWYARWMYHGKVYQQSTGTADKAAAKKMLQFFTAPFIHEKTFDVIDAIDSLKMRVAKSIAKPEIAIDQIWATYEPRHNWAATRDTAKRNYETMIHKLEDWAKRHGCRYVSDVTKEKALAFAKERAEEISIDTFKNALTQYKRVWKTLAECEEYNIIADAWKLCVELKDNQNKSDTREPFTPAEIKAIISNADSDMRLLTLTSLFTGMRLVDCAKLRWSDLDMQHKRLARKTVKRGVWVRMELYPELFAALEEARKTSTGEYVNERNADEYEKGSLGDRFGAILDKCGIKRNSRDDKGRLSIKKSFHSLRHTHASAYYAEGASMSDVAHRIGDTEKTAAKYVHHGYGYTLKGELAEAVREALSGNLCKAA